MSVLAAEPVHYTRFNGWFEPQFPEGSWFGAVASIGDGTGGSNNLALQFNQVGGPLSSRIFTVEQMALFSGETGARIARIEAINLSSPPNLGFRGIYSMALATTSPSGNSVSLSELRLPIFLGSQEDAALISSFAAVIDNVDTVQVTLEVQGYWWGARSVFAPGGPQRPPTGIYGQ